MLISNSFFVKCPLRLTGSAILSIGVMLASFKQFDIVRNGAACVTALDANRACVAGLSCPQYDDYLTEAANYMCASEDVAVRNNCPSIQFGGS